MIRNPPFRDQVSRSGFAGSVSADTRLRLAVNRDLCASRCSFSRAVASGCAGDHGVSQAVAPGRLRRR